MMVSMCSAIDLQQIYAESQQKQEIMNAVANRDLNLDINVELGRFDQKNKLADFGVYWQIFDNISKNPFHAWLRTSPFGGDTKLNENTTNGYYHIIQDTVDTHHPLKSNSILYLIQCPLDEYHIVMFLQFDDDVSILYMEPIDAKKGSSIAENPDWNVEVNADESSDDERNKLIPSDNLENTDIKSVFKFDIVVRHSLDYIIKHLIYVGITFVPIILIVAHVKFVKRKNLGTQAALFTGIAILLITSLFAIRPFLPEEITIIELSLVTIVSWYAVWFYKTIKNRQEEERRSVYVTHTDE